MNKNEIIITDDDFNKIAASLANVAEILYDLQGTLRPTQEEVDVSCDNVGIILVDVCIILARISNNKEVLEIIEKDKENMKE